MENIIFHITRAEKENQLLMSELMYISDRTVNRNRCRSQKHAIQVGPRGYIMFARGADLLWSESIRNTVRAAGKSWRGRFWRPDSTT